MSDLSIHQAERVHDGVDPIEAHADRYFAETRKGDYGKESRRVTKTKGVFVPLKWAERWDFMTAAYLSHFVHYLGTQKRNDGYVWDSEKEVEAKTRITPRQQKRCRDVLKRDGAVHTKRGAGNKWMVRPNLPLLMLFDDVPSWDEAVEHVMSEMGNETQPEHIEDVEESLRNVPTGDDETSAQSLQNVGTVATKGAHSGDKTCPLNTVTPVTHSNSLSGAHARPEPDTEMREEKEEVSPKVSRGVEVLADIERIGDARVLTRRVSNLAEKHPRVDPVVVCKGYRDYVAGMSEPVKSHPALLGKFFEREAGRIESQPVHAHGADAPVFKASEQEVHPRPKIDFKEMQRLMAEGVPDAEAVAWATMYSEEEVA